MKVRCPILIGMFLVSVVASALAQSSSMSTGIMLDATGGTSLQWRTMTSVSRDISWIWPQTAQSARLVVSDGKKISESVINRPNERSIGEMPFSISFPDSETAECVLSFTLSFYTSSDATGEALTAETLYAGGIGLVRGVAGQGTRCYVDGELDDKWAMHTGSSAVLPVLSGASSLTVDGTALPFVYAPGWVLWNSIKGQTYELALTGNALSYVASITGHSAGFTLFIY